MTKVCKLLIQLPPLVIPISNNWYQSAVTQKRPNSLSMIPMDMEQLIKNLEEALEQIYLLNEEGDKLRERYEDSKVYIG